jgi:hypothetical protein
VADGRPAADVVDIAGLVARGHGQGAAVVAFFGLGEAAEDLDPGGSVFFGVRHDDGGLRPPPRTGLRTET